MTNISKTISSNLKRYRVTIESSDWFEVDVLSEDEVAAMNRAECIDGGYITKNVGQKWEATGAREVSAAEFDPPDLPASAWIA